ncbi:maleylpyruvate isomerase family mycothiol-dependent enzyme [Nostocoides vanveenii]|uniref:Maleylpyruvate isomerase family mycothiol-dependent enzyme n=1 Tax=Nostocoides vanveenii TaxID=330835 RepID=A0ABN2KBU8_9MICO
MDETLAALESETARLLATVAVLDDPAAASGCDGWTRGHILTHLARNADGLAGLVRAAVDGSGETMYASAQARDADIEAGAGRAMPDLADDLRTSSARLAQALPRLAGLDAGLLVERTPGGPRFRAADLPTMRLREVLYHHADLRAGFDFEDFPPDLVATYLAREVTALAGLPDAPAVTLAPAGQEPIRVGPSGPTVAGSPAALLRWLARRDPAGVHALDGDVLPELPRGS